MKKLFLILLVVLMALALVACKQEQEDSSSTTNVSEDQGKTNLIAQGSSGSSKGIDYNGFKVTGTYKVAGAVAATVEVGGLNDIYWLATDGDSDGVIDNYLYFAEEDDVLKVYDPSSNVWNEYEIQQSMKEQILDGIADTLLYCSFSLSDSMSGCEITGSGTSSTYNGKACTKYSATYSSGNVIYANMNVYVDNTYAITLGMDFSFTDEFKALAELAGVDEDEYFESIFISYSADADFDLSDYSNSTYTAASKAL